MRRRALSDLPGRRVVTPIEHRIRLHEVEGELVPASWWASCTGCDWDSPTSFDADVVIDAHQEHRKAQS